jgi:hypothetical protein
MEFEGKYFVELVEQILDNGLSQATYILSRTLTVRATRRGKIDNRRKHVEILFTVGKPNHNDRILIKNALKGDKDPFPILKLK